MRNKLRDSFKNLAPEKQKILEILEIDGRLNARSWSENENDKLIKAIEIHGKQYTKIKKMNLL